MEKALADLKDISAILSNTVEQNAKWIFDKLKGKPLKSLPELLREYYLPSGLFPLNITCYEFDEREGKLIVHLPYPCGVVYKDSSFVKYTTTVKAILQGGKLIGIEGMKTKFRDWVTVRTVAVEGSTADKVAFTTGVKKKSRARNAYDVPRYAFRVQEV